MGMPIYPTRELERRPVTQRGMRTNVGDQPLATKRLSMPQDLNASPLHRMVLRLLS
jgi:hypothetical protein